MPKIDCSLASAKHSEFVHNRSQKAVLFPIGICTLSLEIDVGHRAMSDDNDQMSERKMYLVDKNSRPKMQYCRP